MIQYFKDEIRWMVDERGWTLLHIAASAGHGMIVQDLLARGADPDALSKPFMSHMPASIQGQACTPRQVALAQSAEREAQYLQVMRACAKYEMAYTPQVNDCSLDDEEDVFWEASESLA